VAQAFDALVDGSEIDVLIVGAGMVGASTALGVADQGLSVLLVDTFAFQNAKSDYTPSYDARSTAISWGSREILNQLGVWCDVAEHATPIMDVHVSEKGRFGVTRMNAEEFKREALGYVVPNQWLGQCLLKQIDEKNIPLYAPAKVSDIKAADTKTADFKADSDRQLVTLSNLSEQGSETKHIRARLVIIADGTCSATAGLLGVENEIEHYNQHALIANVTTELPNNGVAYERFTSQGPLALLPLTESTSALVWTHNSERIQSFLEMSDDVFCKALQKAFGERLGRITRCGARNAYPLRLVRAKEQFRPGVLLLGNAAHSLHPVAGQGFNLAIRGVASFLESLNQEQTLEGIGCLTRLNRISDGLKKDQSTTILFSDQVVKVFGNSSSLVGLARDVGLIALDNIPMIKSVFASQAMGLAGKKANF